LASVYELKYKKKFDKKQKNTQNTGEKEFLKLFYGARVRKSVRARKEKRKNYANETFKQF
jgi:hypothetical protein